MVHGKLSFSFLVNCRTILLSSRTNGKLYDIIIRTSLILAGNAPKCTIECCSAGYVEHGKLSMQLLGEWQDDDG